MSLGELGTTAVHRKKRDLRGISKMSEKIIVCHNCNN